MDATSIVLLIACFGTAIIIFTMGKENKVFYLASAFFALAGLFFAVRPFLGEILSAPWMEYAVRGVALFVLLILCYFYYKERKNNDGGEK